MRFGVKKRLATVLRQNVDPHREEMVGRAKAAIEKTQAHSELTEQQRREVQRLLASVSREIAVVRTPRGGQAHE